MRSFSFIPLSADLLTGVGVPPVLNVFVEGQEFVGVAWCCLLAVDSSNLGSPDVLGSLEAGVE